MKIPILLAAIALLSGCNTLSNPYAAELAPIAVPSGSGLIVISTGGVDTCATSALSLHFQERGRKYDDPSLAGINVNWGAIKSAFSDHRGAFSVIALKPGDYQLFPRPIDANMRGKRVPKAEFSLASGELLYLGEFFVSTPCNSGFLASFRDQEQRDMELLNSLRPELAKLPHSKRIPTMTGYILEED